MASELYLRLEVSIGFHTFLLIQELDVYRGYHGLRISIVKQQCAIT